MVSMIIPYNSNNKKYARTNRNQYTMTKEEGKIRNLFLRKDITWYRFLRQKLIWNYILDFYCDRLKLWIEIDDLSHDFKWVEDEIRTKYLENLGIKIISYTNKDVNFKLDAVIDDLKEIIKIRKECLDRRETEGFVTKNPHPEYSGSSFKKEHKKCLPL